MFGARCVGSLDADGRLHCVAVRTAHEAEIRLHTKFAAKSDEVLGNWLSNSREI